MFLFYSRMEHDTVTKKAGVRMVSAFPLKTLAITAFVVTSLGLSLFFYLHTDQNVCIWSDDRVLIVDDWSFMSWSNETRHIDGPCQWNMNCLLGICRFVANPQGRFYMWKIDIGNLHHTQIRDYMNDQTQCLAKDISHVVWDSCDYPKLNTWFTITLAGRLQQHHFDEL